MIVANRGVLLMLVGLHIIAKAYSSVLASHSSPPSRNCSVFGVNLSYALAAYCFHDTYIDRGDQSQHNLSFSLPICPHNKNCTERDGILAENDLPVARYDGKWSLNRAENNSHTLRYTVFFYST